MTRRAPQRSTSQPIAGQDNAASAACIVNAEENIARPMPRSAVIGFRKTPNAKTLTAPPPTMRPQTVANTIHQLREDAPHRPFLPLHMAHPTGRIVGESMREARCGQSPLPHRGRGWRTREGEPGEGL